MDSHFVEWHWFQIDQINQHFDHWICTICNLIFALCSWFGWKFSYRHLDEYQLDWYTRNIADMKSRASIDLRILSVLHRRLLVINRDVGFNVALCTHKCQNSAIENGVSNIWQLKKAAQKLSLSSSMCFHKYNFVEMMAICARHLEINKKIPSFHFLRLIDFLFSFRSLFLGKFWMRFWWSDSWTLEIEWLKSFGKQNKMIES